MIVLIRLKRLSLILKKFQIQNDQSKNQEIINKKRICYTKKFKGPIFLDRHGLYVDWQKIGG